MGDDHSTLDGRPVTLTSQLKLLEQFGDEVSLQLPPGLSFESWQAIGELLMATQRRITWWLGDWQVYGEDAYRELSAQGAPDDEHAASTVRAAARVSEAFPPARRRAGLPWAHHRETVGLPPADQERWLDQAEAEHLSSHHLRARIRAERNGHDDVCHHHHCRTPGCSAEWDD